MSNVVMSGKSTASAVPSAEELARNIGALLEAERSKLAGYEEVKVNIKKLTRSLESLTAPEKSATRSERRKTRETQKLEAAV